MRLSIFACLAILPIALGDSVSVQSDSYTLGELGDSPYQTFVSSSIRPPQVNLRTPAQNGTWTDPVFIGYRGTSAQQQAPLIMDNNGSVIWFGTEYGPTMDFKVQTYKSEPVLTFFQGQFNQPGYGNGSYYVLGKDYSLITTIDGVNYPANSSDFHGMTITPNNTALVMSWRLAQTDLSGKNGSNPGWTWDCVFQEIGLDERNLIFEWHSLDHVPVTESYFDITNDEGNSSSNAFDYCHINQVVKDDYGDYLVSLRGPSVLYSVSHTTGEINWRLSGSQSNFTMGENATFYYQHDVQFQSSITQSPFQLSIFDNAAGGYGDAEPYARGILLSVDANAKTAELVQEYKATFDDVANSQGSVQKLPNGNFFVGFGQQPYYTEYTASGEVIYDVAFASQNSTTQSYRAFRESWSGRPSTPPSLALNGSTAYVSWNGASDIASWVLQGGNSSSSLNTLSSAAKTGFETVFSNVASVPLLTVAAVAANGTCLGFSDIIAAANSSTTGARGHCPSGSNYDAPTQSEPTGGNSKGSNGAFRTSASSAAALTILMAGALVMTL